jgi:NhaP-type Na+/H+ or K+/H+ antiporter
MGIFYLGNEQFQ